MPDFLVVREENFYGDIFSDVFFSEFHEDETAGFVIEESRFDEAAWFFLVVYIETNDVANAVGPLAAINDSLVNSGVSATAHIPIWVMMVGAIGISLGLMLYGPKLIKTVGSEITELNKIRAFCVAMAAAITVIIASQLGLPVSSTHIAVGGIFGVGFLREYLKVSYASQLHSIAELHEGKDREQVKKFLEDFKKASVDEMDQMLKKLKAKQADVHLPKSERKRLKLVYREELVKRSHLVKIAAAWVITVPASALLAAILFFTIRGMLMP